MKMLLKVEDPLSTEDGDSVASWSVIWRRRLLTSPNTWVGK